MSLLDVGNEEVIVYPEEVTYDEDGNQVLRPAKDGIPTRAMIRPKAQSGTSARRAEQMDEGYFTEEVYTLRFPRSFTIELGQQSVVEWRGERWSVFGKPRRFNGSPRTRRLEYTIRRN